MLQAIKNNGKYLVAGASLSFFVVLPTLGRQNAITDEHEANAALTLAKADLAHAEAELIRSTIPASPTLARQNAITDEHKANAALTLAKADLTRAQAELTRSNIPASPKP